MLEIFSIIDINIGAIFLAFCSTDYIR